MENIFKSSNLKYKYSWTTTAGDSKLTGEPDKSLLNRDEGYEVLYFINKLMSKWNLKTIASGNKIEELIHKTPGNLRSQENIMGWIDKNW